MIICENRIKWTLHDSPEEDLYVNQLLKLIIIMLINIISENLAWYVCITLVLILWIKWTLLNSPSIHYLFIKKKWFLY